MACCKIPQNRSKLGLAVERRLNATRGVVCSRLFAFSPRLAGTIYRSFGLCVVLAIMLAPVLVFAVASAVT